MEIDARQLKALVSGLRPNTTYEFRVTCMERSDGATRHRVAARTAPLMLEKKPRLEIDVDPDSALTISFPPVESKDIKCVASGCSDVDPSACLFLCLCLSAGVSVGLSVGPR